MTVAVPAADAWQPISRLDPAGLVGLFTDIDDTLTTHGKLPAAVYAALESLADAGFAIVPVTGRSAGWAHLILHQWPVLAVVAESGGVCLHRDAAGVPRFLFHDDPGRIADDRVRIADAAARMMQALPGFALANDNAFRLVDFAIDHSETVPPVSAATIGAAVSRLRAEGLMARASSVHVNVWRGDFDKAPTARRWLTEIRGEAWPQARERWLFVGDAPNDASMFAAFPRSVGVANLAPFADQLPVPPAFLTRASHGDGFVELATRLLEARRAG